MEKIQLKICPVFLALDIYSGYFESEKAGMRKNLSYKVTVDSLGLPQYQLKIIQYLMNSSQPLPSTPSQEPFKHTLPEHPKRSSQLLSKRQLQRPPKKPLGTAGLPFIFNLYSVPSLRQPIPQYKLFDKLLKSSVISSISKDLSSLVTVFLVCHTNSCCSVCLFGTNLLFRHVLMLHL